MKKVSASTDIIRKVKHKTTIEEHVTHYTDLIASINTEIDKRSRNMEGGVRIFRRMRKTLTAMLKELPHVVRSKKLRALITKKRMSPAGLNMKYTISSELARFLQKPSDAVLSRIEATRAICVYAHIKPDESREEILEWSYLNTGGKRDLQDPENKRAILPDVALSKLLNYEKYKRDVLQGKITKKTKTFIDVDGEKSQVIKTVKVTDNALFYWTIQRLVSIHFLAPVVEDKVPDETDESENLVAT